MPLTAAFPGQPSAVAISSHLAAVYRSPELAGLARRPSSGSSLLGQLGQLVLGWLQALYRAGGSLLWVALGLVLLAALGTLAAVLLHRQRGALPAVVSARAPPARGAAPAPSPEALFGRADRLQREGRLSEAVRTAFQGLLLAGSSSPALNFDPSWTNSELLAAAAQRSALEPELRPLVTRFDSVVYGRHEPTLAACREFTSACRRTALAFGR
ncbi:MAG: DUF4129 domain-containing protein [Candidatus Dormiibacterota bacterium]